MVERGGHRLAAADEELTGWYTAAVGVKAQSYDGGSGGGAFDSHEAHTGRLRAMRWLEGRPGVREWYDRVAATVGELDPEHRRVLGLVYTPRAGATWLSSELSTPWGGGSFVALAATLPRAEEAALRAGHVSVHSWWLVLEGTVPTRKRLEQLQSLLGRLRRECEALRLPALAAYDRLRVARIDQERKAAQEAREERARESTRRLEEVLGEVRRRSAARFERRLRRAS